MKRLCLLLLILIILISSKILLTSEDEFIVASDTTFDLHKTVGCENIPGAVVIDGPTEEYNDIINTTDANIFCLQPNEQDYGNISLQVSGTADEPKYLIANYTNSPWEDEPPTKVVAEAISFEIGTSYWYVYGLNLKNNSSSSVVFDTGSHHNEIRDVLIEGGQEWIYEDQTDLVGLIEMYGADFITIRESVIRNSIRILETPEPQVPTGLSPQADPIGYDSHCIWIADSEDVTIENNEIYDCAGDGIHVEYDAIEDPDHLWSSKRLRIASNSLFITSNMYADCENSDPNTSLDPDGDCACAENAIDIKMTHFDEPGNSEDVLIVTGNVMHGFRETHQSCGGSGDAGTALVVHLENPRDIRITRNYIFDSVIGSIIQTDQSDPNINIFNNIFYNQLQDGVRFEGTAGPSLAHNTFYRDLGNIIGGLDEDINSIEINSTSQVGEVYNNRIIGTLQNYSIEVGAGSTYTIEGNYLEGFASIEYEDESDPSASNTVDPLFDPLNYDELCFDLLEVQDQETSCMPDMIPLSTAPLLGHYSTGYLPTVTEDILGTVRDAERDPGAVEFLADLSLPGDMDHDGDIQIDDYALFLEDFFAFRDEGVYEVDADMNGDLIINILDYALWIDAYILFRDG